MALSLESPACSLRAEPGAGGADGSWIRRFGNPLPAEGGRFGARLAALGDLDGDGVMDLGIGAPGDATGDGPGSASLFSTATGNLIRTLELPAGPAGSRLGSVVVALGDVDDDGDGTGDPCDCAPQDPTADTQPGTLAGLVLDGGSPTVLTWASPGVGFSFDVAGGLLSELHRDAGLDAAVCVAEEAPGPTVQDTRPEPPGGDGYYYLPRARNACGAGGFGSDSAGVERLPAGCPWRPERAAGPAPFGRIRTRIRGRRRQSRRTTLYFTMTYDLGPETRRSRIEGGIRPTR